MLFAWKVVRHAEVGGAVVDLLHDLCRAEESEDQRLAGPDPAAAAGSSLSERRAREENPDEYIIVRLPNLGV